MKTLSNLKNSSKIKIKDLSITIDYRIIIYLFAYNLPLLKNFIKTLKLPKHYQKSPFLLQASQFSPSKYHRARITQDTFH